jgi:hypothetical protein
MQGWQHQPPGSDRGTRRIFPPRPEQGAYRLRRQHGQRLGHLLPSHGTPCVVTACMRRRHLQARARASTACAHNATTAERTLTANRRALARDVVVRGVVELPYSEKRARVDRARTGRRWICAVRTFAASYEPVSSLTALSEISCVTESRAWYSAPAGVDAIWH